MPTIGSRRCGIRATASHCLGVALARVAIDRDFPGPSHDGDALPRLFTFMLALQSPQLFDCDEQGAGPALPPVWCLSTRIDSCNRQVWRSRQRARGGHGQFGPAQFHQLVHGSASRRGRIT